MSYNNKTGFYEGYIYKITNDINDKIYIGQTRTTINDRWYGHKYAAKNNKGNSILYDDMRKYGFDNFHISVIRKYIKKNVEDLKSILNIREIYYIDKFDSTNMFKGYNISKGGNDSTLKCKDVDIYDVNGNFIETLPSRKKVSEKYNIDDHTICHLCNDGGNYKGQYIFRNKGELFDSLPISTCYNYKIYQFTTDGNCVGEFFSRNEAVSVAGVRIDEALNQPTKLAGGYWWSTQKLFGYIGNPCFSSVDIYTVKGEYVGNFESCNSAATYLNVNRTSISNCASGKACSIRRKWVSRYTGEPFDKYPTRAIYSKCRKVNQYDLENNYIKTFDSLALAAESVSMYRSAVSNIAKQCNNEINYAFGFKWFYADDLNQPDKSKIIQNVS